MRVVIQRVSEASIEIDGNFGSSIKKGLVILLGIEHADTTEDTEWLIRKIINMRIFSDEQEVMNKSILEVGGEALLVSQFTLHAQTKKGNRPSYAKAANPEIAVPIYNEFVALFENALGKQISTGKFGSDMQVSLINDGPVTILMDSKSRE
ncbi:MAG: D-aminoacyl-tRNA deacylase [Bacteroidota bacterium]